VSVIALPGATSIAALPQRVVNAITVSECVRFNNLTWHKRLFRRQDYFYSIEYTSDTREMNLNFSCVVMNHNTPAAVQFEELTW